LSTTTFGNIDACLKEKGEKRESNPAGKKRKKREEGEREKKEKCAEADPFPAFSGEREKKRAVDDVPGKGEKRRVEGND